MKTIDARAGRSAETASLILTGIVVAGIFTGPLLARGAELAAAPPPAIASPLVSLWIGPGIAVEPRCARGPAEDPPNCPVMQSAPPQDWSRFYATAEYLLWGVKGAPLSIPLVTTGPAANNEGFIINSRTTILYGAPLAPALGGNDAQGFPLFSGSRVTLGYWIDAAQRFAIEGSAFVLQQQTAGFEALGTPGSGAAGMRIPVFNTVPYAPGGPDDLRVAENGLPVSIPGILSGGVGITESLQLWGASATAVVPVRRSSFWELDAVGGVRYLELSEGFNLVDRLAGLSGPFVAQSGAVMDQFQTDNMFFGATAGLRASYAYGPLSIELSAMLGIGVDREILAISGGYEAFNYHGPFAAGPEGIFAQPSNEGTRSSDAVAVVPEARITLGYALTSSMRVTVGYDFLYESSVVRPGDQLDRNLPKGQIFQQGGSAISSTMPAALFKTTDFYAQGLSAGLCARF